MANECFKRRVGKKILRCPICFGKLKEGNSYYVFTVSSENVRRRFKHLFPRRSALHFAGYVCENCYPKLPEEFRKIIEQRDFTWELDLEKGFWFNRETKEKEYFENE